MIACYGAAPQEVFNRGCFGVRDNAVAESFFGTLEQELVKDSDWHDLKDARRAVSN